MARGRKRLHLKRTGLAANRRIRRPSLGETLRDADRRARQRANQRTWRRRGVTSMQSAIADSHYAPPDEMGLGGRLLRLLAGLALVPLGAITTVTLFELQLPQHAAAAASGAEVSAAAETVKRSFWGHFWRQDVFLYFAVGFVLNAGWFFTRLIQPFFLYLYVLGHELTHAAFVYLCFGRVSGFRVGLDGGHIVTNKSNILIALSPYFVPFWSVAVLAIMALLGLVAPLPHHDKILFLFMGATWSFHLFWTLWIIPRDQPDLKENGTFFSLALIYLANVVLLAGMVAAYLAQHEDPLVAASLAAYLHGRAGDRHGVPGERLAPRRPRRQGDHLAPAPRPPGWRSGGR